MFVYLCGNVCVCCLCVCVFCVCVGVFVCVCVLLLVEGISVFMCVLTMEECDIGASASIHHRVDNSKLYLSVIWR